MSSAVNSGPWSERMWAGTLWVTKSSASVSSTSIDRNHRATTIARHSREYSSTMVRIFSGRPSCVRSATKSYAQTWCRYSGVGRQIDLILTRLVRLIRKSVLSHLQARGTEHPSLPNRLRRRQRPRACRPEKTICAPRNNGEFLHRLALATLQSRRNTRRRVVPNWTER